EQTHTLVLSRWSTLGRWLRFDLGDETVQRRSAGLIRSHVDRCRLAEKQAAQDLDEGSEGHARGLRIEAVAANHQRATRARHRREFGDETSLADSRLTSEEDQARVAPPGLIQAGLQLGTLHDPADEDRARDAANHGADHRPA